MRTRWKLIALAFVAIVVCLLLVPTIATLEVKPIASVEVKVDLPVTAVRSEDLADQTGTWIGKAILTAFAVVVLGVLAWVARHILRRPREPDA
jgi:cytochrome b561